MAWQKAANVTEVPPGAMKRVTLDDDDIALYHVDGGFYATSDTCTHASQSLTEGSLQGTIVACPKHGGKFDVCTGAAVALPCVYPIATYPVEVRGEEIWVDT